MIKFFARFITVVFHPLAMPSYLTLIYFYLMETPGYEGSRLYYLLALIFTATFIIPTWLIFFLYKIGVSSDLTLSNRTDRFVPLLLTSIVYGGTSILLTRLHVEQDIVWAIAAIGSMIFITGIISLFWKISAHAIGISGVVGFVLRYAMSYLTPAAILFLTLGFIFSGIVLSSRLYLQAHTPQQVYYGYLAGLLYGIVCSFVIL